MLIFVHLCVCVSGQCQIRFQQKKQQQGMKRASMREDDLSTALHTPTVVWMLKTLSKWTHAKC